MDQVVSAREPVRVRVRLVAGRGGVMPIEGMWGATGGKPMLKSAPVMTNAGYSGGLFRAIPGAVTINCGPEAGRAKGRLA